MLSLMEVFAYGPVGGIDAGVAVKWVVIWSAVLGSLLYGSLYLKPWPDLED